MNVSEPFADRLAMAIREKSNPLVVGLDPRMEHLPAGMLPTSWGDEVDAIAQAYRWFCYGVIDVVAELVPAVKPQAAFFEQLGPVGMRVLCQVVEYAHDKGLLVIIDGKRSDIGTTAEAYAKAYLGIEESPWRGDALTVSPYLGGDSLQPFVDRAVEAACGLFVLVKTSNSGGGMFQDLVAEGKTIYRHVADFVQSLNVSRIGASGFGPVGAVVGATYPVQLGELREAMPNTWLLIPGFGAQGGEAQDVAPGFDSQGMGAVINSSRAIIFAYRRDEYRDRFGDSDWQQAVEAATRETIATIRDKTPAGRL